MNTRKGSSSAAPRPELRLGRFALKATWGGGGVKNSLSWRAAWGHRGHPGERGSRERIDVVAGEGEERGAE